MQYNACADRHSIRERPLQLDSHFVVFRRDLIQEHPQRPAARWPRAREMFDDLRDLSRRFLIDGAGKRPFSIGPETRIFAFGSCFAENLAVQLRRSGHASEHVRFAEIVNSTYANRYFLEWLLDTGYAPTL